MFPTPSKAQILNVLAPDGGFETVVEVAGPSYTSVPLVHRDAGVLPDATTTRYPATPVVGSEKPDHAIAKPPPVAVIVAVPSRGATASRRMESVAGVAEALPYASR